MTLTLDRSTVTIDDIRGLGTIKVELAAAFLGVSRNFYYDGVKSGALPGLTLGRRVLVPVSKLLQLVGVSETSA